MSEWQLLTLVLTFATWFAGPPSSLGDVARREAWRRQLMPRATKVLTNQDVATVPPRPLPTVPAYAVEPPAKEGGGKDAETKEAAAKGSETAAKPKETRDESWWRGRMTAARSALERDQLLADAMQTRINSLTNDASARDNPAQRQLLYEARTRAITELDNLRKQLDADRKAIADIEEEARKEGAPSAWIR